MYPIWKPSQRSPNGHLPLFLLPSPSSRNRTNVVYPISGEILGEISDSVTWQSESRVMPVDALGINNLLAQPPARYSHQPGKTEWVKCSSNRLNGGKGLVLCDVWMKARTICWLLWLCEGVSARDVKNMVASMWRGNYRFCRIQKRVFRCEWGKMSCATVCEVA